MEKNFPFAESFNELLYKYQIIPKHEIDDAFKSLRILFDFVAKKLIPFLISHCIRFTVMIFRRFKIFALAFIVKAYKYIVAKRLIPRLCRLFVTSLCAVVLIVITPFSFPIRLVQYVFRLLIAFVVGRKSTNRIEAMKRGESYWYDDSRPKHRGIVKSGFSLLFLPLALSWKIVKSISTRFTYAFEWAQEDRKCREETRRQVKIDRQRIKDDLVERKIKLKEQEAVVQQMKDLDSLIDD